MRSPPKNASTVLLLRSEEGDAFEVLMTRRPPEMEFLGGYYVFPGGVVEQSDCSAEIMNRCHGLSGTEAQRVLGSQFGPELSLGHWVAGIRELFEEVGILLCVTETGGRVDTKKDKVRRMLALKREALVKGSMDFLGLLQSEALYCDVRRLAYFYHRVTPERSSIRFDTRFYLARSPAGQTALPNSEEVTESLWITPEDALERYRKGDFPVIPPTLYSLRTLAEIDSWESLCEKYQLC